MKATTGHHVSERQGLTEEKGETLNARWGWTEHIDRKLDLGDISFTSLQPITFVQNTCFG